MPKRCSGSGSDRPDESAELEVQFVEEDPLAHLEKLRLRLRAACLLQLRRGALRHLLPRPLLRPLSARVEANCKAIAVERVEGVNEALFRRCRLDPSLLRKRNMAKASKPSDFCVRYRSAADVWRYLMREPEGGPAQHASQSSVASVSSSIANATAHMTRAKRKQLELYRERKARKQQKRRMTEPHVDGRPQARARLSALGRQHGARWVRRRRGRAQPARAQAAPRLQPAAHERQRHHDGHAGQGQAHRDRAHKIDLSDVDLGSAYDMSAMVGGLDEAVTVLKDTVLLPLLYPELFSAFSLKPTKGVVLYGPPGTGKTLLVRAQPIKYYYAMSKETEKETVELSKNEGKYYEAKRKAQLDLRSRDLEKDNVALNQASGVCLFWSCSGNMLKMVMWQRSHVHHSPRSRTVPRANRWRTVRPA